MTKEIIETIMAGITAILVIILLAVWFFNSYKEEKKRQEEEQKKQEQFQEALIKQLQDANDNIKFIYECLFPTEKLKEIEDLKE